MSNNLGMGELQAANAQRDLEWDPEGKITIEFRAAELAGEVGEACNLMKKLARERMGLRGSRANLDDLMDELADVVICASLSANHIGGNLSEAIRRKFNATSKKQGLNVFL